MTEGKNVKVTETEQDPDDRSAVLDALAGYGNLYVFIRVLPDGDGIKFGIEVGGPGMDKGVLRSIVDRTAAILAES